MTNGSAKIPLERRRAPKRRALQRTVLDAARALLENSGPDALTMEQVAAQAGMTVENVNACFRNTNELLLALAANELASMARGVYADEKGDPKQWMASSSGALSLLRAAKQILGNEPAAAQALENAVAVESEEPAGEDKPDAAADPAPGWVKATETEKPRVRRFDLKAAQGAVKPGVTAELGTILNDLTSEELPASASTTAQLSRLERRLGLVEREIAQRQEPKDEQADPAAALGERMGAFDQRLGAVEKVAADLKVELRAAVYDLSARLRFVEALPPAPPSAEEMAESERVLKEATALARQQTLETPEPGDSSETGESSDSDNSQDLEIVLAAARRAAIEAAAAKAEPVDHAGNPLSRFMPAARPVPVSGNKRTYLIAASLAALVMVGVGGFALQSGALGTTRAPAATAVVQPRPKPAAANALLPIARLAELAGGGHAKAELLLGLAYLDGNSVAKDEAEAFHWLELSAKHNEPVAQYWLATLYARENGPRSNPAEAARWYESAARGGNRMAMNNLAVAHAQGLGTKKDMREAAHWFAEAAALGYPVSQFNLAVLYERGDGVKQNLAEAYTWYAIAAASGDTEAQKRVTLLSAELDPAALAKARAKAEAFRPKAMNAAANQTPKAANIIGG